MHEAFDVARAHLRGPDFFRRFVVPDAGRPLTDARLAGDTELLIAERGGQQRAFVMGELSRPHLAQGTLATEPYLVSF